MWEFTIKINTPENTQIEFELAGIGNRFAAMLIDYFILLVLNLIIFVISVMLSVLFADIFKQLGEALIAIIGLIVFFIDFNGYFIFFEYLWSGQTPGKRLMNIRVIRENGQPVGFLEVLIRNIFRIPDSIIGPYFVLFSKKEKRLGDYVIGTIVIKEKDVSIPIVDTTVPEGFNSDIPNISRLTPKDFTLIGSYLKRKEDFEEPANENLLNDFIDYYFDKLSLNSVYNIEKPKELSYNEKLKWLIEIYNAYKARGRMSTISGGNG